VITIAAASSAQCHMRGKIEAQPEETDEDMEAGDDTNQRQCHGIYWCWQQPVTGMRFDRNFAGLPDRDFGHEY